MTSTDLFFTPATELDRLIRMRAISPIELTRSLLERIERLNPKLNAFLMVTADLALAQAKAAEGRAMHGARLGPMDGIPYSIKDLEQTAGVRTTFGSKWFEKNIPTEDGVVAARLKKTGGVLLGKTNTPNFGHKDSCDNLLGPPCRNPWKLDRTSGASSGGAGSAIAAGLGPVAHGSDGAGSIRIPSSLCGIFGFKPSFGRIPYAPSADYWAARAHNGTMTRTVRDGALLLEAIAGPDPRDPLTIDGPPQGYIAGCDGNLQGLRVVWSADLGYAPVDPEVRTLCEAAARRFDGFDCSLELRNPAWPDPGAFHKIIYEVSVAARQIDRFRERPEWIEPSLRQMIENAEKVPVMEHAKALLARSVFYDQVRRFFETCDLLLTPQMPVAAWAADPGPSGQQGPTEIAGRSTPTMFDRLPFTFPFNLTGQPAATVPCGFTSEGLPVGLQIVGRWHDDATVLRAAACFEAVQPWTQIRPPIE